MDALKFVIQDDEALLGTRIKVIGIGATPAHADHLDPRSEKGLVFLNHEFERVHFSPA